MNNVISFPRPKTTAPRRAPVTRAKTLFLHVRRTTMIAHLAAASAGSPATRRLGETS